MTFPRDRRSTGVSWLEKALAGHGLQRNKTPSEDKLFLSCLLCYCSALQPDHLYFSIHSAQSSDNTDYLNN